MASNPAAGFPSNAMPGEPPSSVPRVKFSKPQATTQVPKSRKIVIKQHTRTITPKAPKAPAAPQAPAVDQTTKDLINAAVRLKFGGQQQGINQELAANSRFANGAPSWYQQAIQQIQAQAQPVPQTTMPAPTGDPAQDSRNAAAYGFQQQRNNALGAGNQFLTNVGAGLTAASANSVNAANAQRQGILGQQTQLKANEGDFKAVTLADQQATQQKANIENAKIQASLYIAQGKTDMAQKVLESLNQDRQAKNTVARVNARTQRKNANTSRESLQLREYITAHPKLSTKGGGAKGPNAFTPTQVRKSASTFRTLAATLDENAVSGNPNGAVDALVKGKKTDPVIANAVVESILNHGSVTRNTATLYYRATGQHLHVSPHAVPVSQASKNALSDVLKKNVTTIKGALDPLAKVK